MEPATAFRLLEEELRDAHTPGGIPAVLLTP
eukprot:ctg_6555.g667